MDKTMISNMFPSLNIYNRYLLTSKTDKHLKELWIINHNNLGMFICKFRVAINLDYINKEQAQMLLTLSMAVKNSSDFRI